MEGPQPLDHAGPQRPFSVNLRIKLFLTGVLFPAFSVAAGIFDGQAGMQDPWQSGELREYVILFLQSHGVLCFLPAILYSMISLCAITWNPENVRHLWVRIGLYGGAILSTQFLFAVMMTSHVISLMFAGFAGPGLALVVWGCSAIAQRFHRFTILHLMIATAVVAIVLATLIAAEEKALSLIFLPILLIFVAAPTLNFVTYLRMAVFAASHELPQPNSRGHVVALLASIVAWLAGFWVAWRFAIVRVLDEYQNLPTTNPNCFIASAAAHGSPKLVKSVSIEGPNGLVKLNYQMQRLKFLELALQSTLPLTHRLLRRIYNRIGPHVAKLCKASATTANVAYLILKPVELFAEFVRSVTGISSAKVKKLYFPHN